MLLWCHHPTTFSNNIVCWDRIGFVAQLHLVVSKDGWRLHDGAALAVHAVWEQAVWMHQMEVEVEAAGRDQVVVEVARQLAAVREQVLAQVREQGQEQGQEQEQVLGVRVTTMLVDEVATMM